MENCLVTKLKHVVDNNNLLQLGDMVINVKRNLTPSATRQRFSYSGSGRVIDGYIVDSDLSSNPRTSFEANAGNLYFDPNYDCKLVLHDKYNATEINMGWGGMINQQCEMDMKEFSYMPLLVTINIGACAFENADIANISSQALQYLSLFNTNARGDASKLSPILKNFGIDNCSWKSVRPSTSSIFSMGNSTTAVDLGEDLDAYLTNIVNCTFIHQNVNVYIAGTETASTASLAAAFKTVLNNHYSGSKLFINGNEITL